MVEDCSWESVSSSPIHLQQWNNPTLTSWWLMSCWCSKQVLFWKIKLKSFAMRWSSLSGGENDHYLWLNKRKERRKSSYTIKLLCRKKRQKRRTTEPKEFRKKTRMRKGEGRQMGGGTENGLLENISLFIFIDATSYCTVLFHHFYILFSLLLFLLIFFFFSLVQQLNKQIQQVLLFWTDFTVTIRVMKLLTEKVYICRNPLCIGGQVSFMLITFCSII